jgi:hypothetical protein
VPCCTVRFVSFIDIVLCVYMVNCLSFNIGDFWRIVCGAVCFCRDAFPLVMLSRSFFPPVFAFAVFVCVLGGARCFRVIIGKI